MEKLIKHNAELIKRSITNNIKITGVGIMTDGKAFSILTTYQVFDKNCHIEIPITKEYYDMINKDGFADNLKQELIKQLDNTSS